VIAPEAVAALRDAITRDLCLALGLEKSTDGGPLAKSQRLTRLPVGSRVALTTGTGAPAEGVIFLWLDDGRAVVEYTHAGGEGAGLFAPAELKEISG